MNVSIESNILLTISSQDAGYTHLDRRKYGGWQSIWDRNTLILQVNGINMHLIKL